MLSSIASALITDSPDALLIANEEGYYIDANPAALALLGYTREELVRLSVRDIVAPGPVWAAEEFSRYVRDGKWQGDVELRAKDGRLVAAEAHAVVIPGPDGPIFAAFHRDLTHRRRLEVDVRAAEARYRSLVEHLPVVVALNAPDAIQSTLYISPNCEEIFGYSPADYLADPRLWIRTMHPDDREWVLANLQRMNVSGEAVQDEYRMLTRDGQVVWILEDSTLVRDDDGQPLYWQTVQLDVTARKLAEERQQQSEERFRAAFDYAAIGMALVSPNGNFLQVNAALCELTGYEETELHTRTFQDITHPDDLAADLAQVGHLLAGEIRAYEMEKRYIHKAGEFVWGHLSVALVRDQQGEPLHFISQIEDITTRKRAEENLQAALAATQAANRAKGLFLDMMSHELRTPLQAVLGYAESLLIHSRDTLTLEQREDIGYIHQGGGRMLTLVNQLLDLSRMGAGRLELVQEAVDLAQVVEAVRQDVGPQVAAKGLDLQIRLAPPLPWVLGDEERVRQILLNLVGNAVKFTDAGGVTISAAETTGGEVEVLIRDTGVGILAADIPHIFEEFRQVDSRLSRRHGGAGLGLAISTRLAEQMAGRIEVSSEPGIGSTFRLYLPASQS
jgi:two-component system, sensor histidine kinase and response regulator